MVKAYGEQAEERNPSTVLSHSGVQTGQQFIESSKIAARL